MEVIVRAPLSIHFTGTHVRTIGGIKEPWGVATNSNGELFVVDRYGSKGVLHYSSTGEMLCYVPSLGALDKSRKGYCYYPTGIAIDGNDSFILVDIGCYRIQKFKLSSDRKEAEFIKSAGAKGKKDEEFGEPIGIRVNKVNGDIYVCDKNNHRVQVLDQGLQFKSSFGQEGDGTSDFRKPQDIDFDSMGNIYVVDHGHSVIKVFSQSWNYQGAVGRKGHGNGSFDSITSLCIDKHDYIYVTDKSLKCVQVFNPRREFVMQFELPKRSKWYSSDLCGIAVDDNGLIYVGCKATGSVHVYK